MGVSVGGCFKQIMVFRIDKEREREGKWRLDQDQGSVKLDMRQTIALTCALDGGNYSH